MASEVDELRTHLRDGIGAGDAAQLRGRLDLPEDADDATLGRRLVTRLAAHGFDEHQSPYAKGLVEDPRPVIAPRAIGGADASFLGRLDSAAESGAGGFAVTELDDARTLLAVLRAGNLRQRRAAVKRLTVMLTSPRKSIPSDQLKRVAEVLPKVRDVEIAYELSEARAQLPGAQGREYKAERESFARTVAELTESIRRYWEAETVDEPFIHMPSDQRAQLQMRMRDLPDVIVAHLGAALESGEVMLSDVDRQGLIEALRYSGEPRLVPSLIAVLDGGDAEAAVDAARALGRIDDPRVHPALVSAYERSVLARNKVVLAGALGLAGDARGRGYIRDLLAATDDPRVTRRSLEALGALGTPEDTEAIGAQTAVGDTRLKMQAVRSLGAVGDGRALSYLRELREQTSVSAMWAEIEDAEGAIRARLELRGEEEEGGAALSPVEKDLLALPTVDPLLVRFLGFKDYLFGAMWLFFGAFERAMSRFERASARRADWARPHLRTAMAHAGRNRHAPALAAFRRAIEVDRIVIEQNAAAMRVLVTVFLRRADEVEGEGRRDIARGLLEEVTSLDLRRAPSALRFEVSRRHDAARRGAG
ncbi:MAG: hypothetical protein DRJ42_21140 [Deltaproteobacteria bacterium]|nr:MAG: hypothetical protein DRJ42_21140 [Deltaproteobacteria bacterium]